MNGHFPPGQPDDVFSVEPLHRGRPDPRPIAWAPDPAPIADELLSSWLSRRAWSDAMAPDAFLRSLRSSLGQTIPDLDGVLPSRLFAFLSHCTGMPMQRFEAMQRFAHPPDTVWARLFGASRFCPQCWMEDEAPYVRWRWRAASFGVCTAHDVWLCNRCPACKAPLSILRGSKRRPLWRCAGCQLDLRTATAMRASADAVRGQSLILDIIDLAEEIGRPRLVEQALSILHDGDVRKDGRLRSARTGLALLGRSWGRAYSLLDGIPRGGVRTHLLRLLHGGSLEAALATGPRPVRCWEPATEPKAQPIGNRDSSVTLYDLLSQHGKLRARKQFVRPATINDIPQVQRLFRLLYRSDIGDGWYEDHGMQSQQAREEILAARWRSLIHKKVPFLVAHDGLSIVGLVFGEQEKVVILLVDPRGGAVFIPVLLEGIVRVMLNRGARHLKVSVSQADQRFFEEAGWRSSGAGAKPGQVSMEYSTTAADVP